MLTDSAIKPNLPSAPAGTVTFSVTNAGTVAHELDVLRTDIAQDKIPNDPAHPAQVQEPGLVGRILLPAPGTTATLTLALGSGSYVLVCNQPAHYLVGMHTAFTIN